MFGVMWRGVVHRTIDFDFELGFFPPGCAHDLSCPDAGTKSLIDSPDVIIGLLRVALITSFEFVAVWVFTCAEKSLYFMNCSAHEEHTYLGKDP